MRPTTKFLLIRHGIFVEFGKRLLGRTPHIHLSEEGKAQTLKLVNKLEAFPIRAIYSSPLERTMETATPVSQVLNLPIQVSPALNEIDYGEWAGRDFEELGKNSEWLQFNSFRSGIRIPNGELITEVQTRAVNEIERLRRKHPNATLALFTHGDVIKSIIAYYLGIPIDFFMRFEISPASMSILDLNDFGPIVHKLNQ